MLILQDCNLVDTKVKERNYKFIEKVCSRLYKSLCLPIRTYVIKLCFTQVGKSDRRFLNC